MKLSRTFFILLFFIQICQAKNVAKYLQLANSYYDRQQFDSAAIQFDLAIKSSKHKDGDIYYNAACVQSILNNTEKSETYLKKSIDLGNVDFDYFLKDSDLDNLKNSKHWENIEKYYKQKIVTLDTSLMHRLSKIRDEDQRLRIQLMPLLNKIDSVSKNLVQHIAGEMFLYDSLHKIEIIKIIDKYGWPGKSMVGASGNSTIWLIVQHNLDIQKKYLPLLKASVKKGESSKKDLAYLEDRINVMLEHKPQKYGTQSTKNSTTNTYELAPLRFSKKKTNRLRSKLGMSAL